MPRNASGTYSLPVAAFVAGTTILSASMNSNLSDIATALTQSLATTGVSSMTGPLKLAAGTESAPSLTLASDTTTGWYNNATGEWTWVSAGSDVFELAAAGATLTGTFTASGATTLQSTLAVTGAATFNSTISATVGTFVGTTTHGLIVRNTANTVDVHGLIQFQLGSGAGTKASINAVSDGSNGITELRTYVGSTHSASFGTTGINFVLPLVMGTGSTIIMYTEGHTDYQEIAAPSAPNANTARFYCKDLEAETMLAYKDSTGREKPVAPVGSIIGTAFGTYLLAASLTGTIPLDDTIPQQSEGDLLIALAYTVKYATSKLRIRARGVATLTGTGSPSNVILAVFEDGTNDAKGVSWVRPSAASVGAAVVLECEYTPGVAAGITLHLKSGSNNGGTYGWNANTAGSRLFGGVSAVTLEVEEILQ